MGLFDTLRGLFGGSGEGGASGGPSGGSGGSSDGSDDAKDVTEFGPADFRREAEEFAADHEEEDFDFTLASLVDLDEYAAAQTEVVDLLAEDLGDDTAVTGGMRDAYVLWFGSYFGETLVREFDGEWVTDGDGVHVELPAGDTAVQAPVLDAAAIAVRDEPQFATMAEELEAEIERAERGVDPSPSVGGSGDDAGGPPLPDVELEPGMDLDEAHERAVGAFDEAGFYVTEGTIMNSVDGPLDGAAKLFNFHDDAGMYTGVVYADEWDEEVANGVLSLASSIRPEPSDGVFVVSATEPPAALEYLTGAHPRSAYALEAKGEVQNGPAFAADAAEHYAAVGRELVARHFGVEVDVDDVDELETIDDLVLSELRPEDDPERPAQGYVPHDALVPIGTLAGEVMRSGFERDHGASTAWSDGQGVSSTGVALTVTAPDGGEITVNPVGKVFKLFENGSEDSVAYMYRTSVAAMNDEL